MSPVNKILTFKNNFFKVITAHYVIEVFLIMLQIKQTKIKHFDILKISTDQESFRCLV